VKKRSSAVAAVLMVVTLPIAGHRAAALASSRAAGVTHTVKHVVDPVTATGLATGYQIVKRIRGDCWTGSEAVVGPSRCMSHDLIHDPCWFDPAVSNHHVVVCPVQPSSRHLIRLHSHTRVSRDKGGRIHHAWPWGVTLANGWQCATAEGARDSFRGKVVNWSCGRHPGRHYRYLGGIYGSLHRGHQPWRASFVIWHPKRGHYSNGGTITVSDVWYGKVRDR
jgi:hypothetical protein